VYATEANQWLYNHPGLGIPQSDIYLIFRNAYEKVAKMKIAKESLQATGLHPFNPDFFFSDEDFLLLEFINRPQGNFKEDPPGESGKELQMPVSIKQKATEGSASSNRLKNISPPEGSVEKEQGARISPSNIFPLPKAKAAIRWGRSGRRSEIMTCSPFKNSLLNITKIRRAKDPTRPEAKLYDGPTVGRPSCSGNKKEKRSIFCPGCDVQYEEPITEDWIQCMNCHKWGREQSSNI
jgi:hypothetical protein